MKADYHTMEHKDILAIISWVFGAGGIGTALFVWFTNRKKENTEITMKITAMAETLIDTNDKLIKNLSVRIDELETEVSILSERNKELTNKLTAVSNLVLNTTGDSIPKTEVAKLLK